MEVDLVVQDQFPKLIWYMMPVQCLFDQLMGYESIGVCVVQP